MPNATCAVVEADGRCGNPAKLAGTPIHTLWIGDALGPLEWLCLRSWVRLGYRVVLHTYQDMVAPDGVEFFDAGRLVPPQKIFRCARRGSLAGFSDLYRAKILETFPAIWLDSDIFLVRRADFSWPNIIAWEGEGRNYNFNNALMKLSPGHPILKEILVRFEHPFSALDWRKPRKVWSTLLEAALSLGLEPRHLPWGALGGLAIEACVAKNGFEGRIIGPECCLTMARVPLFERIDDPDAALARPVFYVHMYRSQLKVDLAHPVPGSVYARLWDLVEGRVALND